jgi:murein DD-endopeptidase MepM/ murein hydrolase activator NlpD
MPISDLCDADIVTQPFNCTDYSGEWVRPDCPGGHFHAGVDLGYSDGGNKHLGSPIYSPRDGEVVAIGPYCPSCGNEAQYLGPYAPCIRTVDGVIIELGHVQAVYVNVGDRVTAGQHVADLGSLGASSAGHLHVEVRRDGPIQGPPWDQVLDPLTWLRLPRRPRAVLLSSS